MGGNLCSNVGFWVRISVPCFLFLCTCTVVCVAHTGQVQHKFQVSNSFTTHLTIHSQRIVPSHNILNCILFEWETTYTTRSFGVPIKSKVATSLHIDPLVMQTYKTGMCFLTSWLFLYVRNEKVTFTPMGLLSGLFWVPGGIASKFAFDNFIINSCTCTHSLSGFTSTYSFQYAIYNY